MTNIRGISEEKYDRLTEELGVTHAALMHRDFCERAALVVLLPALRIRIAYVLGNDVSRG